MLLNFFSVGMALSNIYTGRGIREGPTLIDLFLGILGTRALQMTTKKLSQTISFFVRYCSMFIKTLNYFELNLSENFHCLNGANEVTLNLHDIENLHNFKIMYIQTSITVN